MVLIKTNKAVGSLFGLGTHTWLEITHREEKLTYSGSKGKNNIFYVLKNYKRDYDRESAHGTLVIDPPNNLTEEQWAEVVTKSAENILSKMHENYMFCGLYPYGKSNGMMRANCCTVLNKIITNAGGTIPKGKIKGFTPGLR